jgi:hypothetical protein
MHWCSWLRHCAASQKVVGLLPGGVSWVFHWHNPLSHTTALGSAQPDRNVYKEYFLEGRGGWCLGLMTLLPSWTNCLEIWNLNLLEISGPVQACNGITLPLQLKKPRHWLLALNFFFEVCAGEFGTGMYFFLHYLFSGFLLAHLMTTHHHQVFAKIITRQHIVKSYVSSF